MQREVGADASWTWLGNDDTRRDSCPWKDGAPLGVTTAGGEAWACVWKSELLFHRVLELGNDDWSRAFALGQLVDDP